MMERGPVALFSAIVAVGLGPAMWLGVQFSTVEDAPAPRPAVSELSSGGQELLGGRGAGSDAAIDDRTVVTPTPRVKVRRTTKSPTPSPSASPSAIDPVPSAVPSEPAKPSNSPSASPTEPTPDPTDPTTGGPTVPPEPPADGDNPSSTPTESPDGDIATGTADV